MDSMYVIHVLSLETLDSYWEERDNTARSGMRLYRKKNVFDLQSHPSP